MARLCALLHVNLPSNWNIELGQNWVLTWKCMFEMSCFQTVSRLFSVTCRHVTSMKQTDVSEVCTMQVGIKGYRLWSYHGTWDVLNASRGLREAWLNDLRNTDAAHWQYRHWWLHEHVCHFIFGLLMMCLSHQNVSIAIEFLSGVGEKNPPHLNNIWIMCGKKYRMLQKNYLIFTASITCSFF